MRKKIIKRVALFLFLAFVWIIIIEMIRAYLYYKLDYGPEIIIRQDIKLYVECEYMQYKDGEEAARFLPSTAEINNATYADFLYIDTTPQETAFGNCATGFCIGLQYDDDEYNKQKSAVIANEQYVEQYVEGASLKAGLQAGLISMEKIGAMKYLYYGVICSDKTNSIVYIVCIDRVNYEGAEMRNMQQALGLRTTDFWKFFCQGDVEE